VGDSSRRLRRCPSLLLLLFLLYGLDILGRRRGVAMLVRRKVKFDARGFMKIVRVIRCKRGLLGQPHQGLHNTCTYSSQIMIILFCNPFKAGFLLKLQWSTVKLTMA
jgi:hypothetical protein